ncbi:GIY-YIG nuclease family protein [Calothrix sp. CCY 0018]|uniref:GIY-YIG nuclease family protein n=1 Tax=Calothrix sp. CCY 0018 TaxID=3103864 RepID=UPI0039C5E145
MTDFGYIYLIHAVGTNRYKIGKTIRDVEIRYKELNSKQSPYPLKCMGYIETHNLREVEKILHDTFKDSRVHGEWFCFDKKDIRMVEAAIYNQAHKPEIPLHPHYEYDIYDFHQPILLTLKPIDEAYYFDTGEIVELDS